MSQHENPRSGASIVLAVDSEGDWAAVFGADIAPEGSDWAPEGSDWFDLDAPAEHLSLTFYHKVFGKWVEKGGAGISGLIHLGPTLETALTIPVISSVATESCDGSDTPYAVVGGFARHDVLYIEVTVNGQIHRIDPIPPSRAFVAMCDANGQAVLRIFGRGEKAFIDYVSIST